MSQEGSEAGVPVVAAFHHPAFACVSQGGSTVPGSPKRNQRGLSGTDEGHCRRHPRPTKTHPRGAAAGGSEGCQEESPGLQTGEPPHYRDHPHPDWPASGLNPDRAPCPGFLPSVLTNLHTSPVVNPSILGFSDCQLPEAGGVWCFISHRVNVLIL